MSEASKNRGVSAGPPPAQPEEVSFMIPGPPPPRFSLARKRALLALTHLAAACLGALGAWALLGPWAGSHGRGANGPPKEPPGNRQVTLDTFNKIQPNMAYSEVQGLFGDAGRRVGLNGVGEVFEWTGRQDMAEDRAGPQPKISVTISEHKVIDKEARNLK